MNLMTQEGGKENSLDDGPRKPCATCPAVSKTISLDYSERTESS